MNKIVGEGAGTFPLKSAETPGLLHRVLTTNPRSWLRSVFAMTISTGTDLAVRLDEDPESGNTAALSTGPLLSRLLGCQRESPVALTTLSLPLGGTAETDFTMPLGNWRRS